jgi:hypothetical protein
LIFAKFPSKDYAPSVGNRPLGTGRSPFQKENMFLFLVLNWYNTRIKKENDLRCNFLPIPENKNI